MNAQGASGQLSCSSITSPQDKNPANNTSFQVQAPKHLEAPQVVSSQPPDTLKNSVPNVNIADVATTQSQLPLDANTLRANHLAASAKNDTIPQTGLVANVAAARKGHGSGGMHYHQNEQITKKQQHTKEDVDAGNTLLVFLQELRKNHNQAMSAGKPTSVGSPGQNCCQSQATSDTSSSGITSLSTARLVDEGFSNSCYSETSSVRSSTLQGIQTESVSGSVRSEISSESASSSNRVTPDSSSSSDEDLRVNNSCSGPIRKRFKRSENNESLNDGTKY
jgi:hypothetical protein